MKENIFLIGANKELVELMGEPYNSEDLLQSLLEDYPKLIPGSQINPDNPRRWLLVTREKSIADDNKHIRWALDHLFLDQDGIPTLIEVKRSSDTRLRREVIGQMLDYAAHASVHWSVDEIIKTFENGCIKKGIDSDVKLAEFLEDERIDSDSFWGKVKTNLSLGKLRLIFVADVFPSELKRVIEFLNIQMNPTEVLGVEIKQYTGEGLKTLVPRTVGLTQQAQELKSQRTKKKWSRDTFFEELEKNEGKDIAETAKKILEWAQAKNNTQVWWGEGSIQGSFAPAFDFDIFYTFFAVWTYGSIEIHFQYLKAQPFFKDAGKRLEILNRLNSIEGVNLPENSFDKRPSFNIGVLSDETNLSKFLDIFDRILSEISRAE